MEADCIPALKPLNDRIQQNYYVLGSNAGMKLEQWGNTCIIVRELLAGDDGGALGHEVRALPLDGLADQRLFRVDVAVVDQLLQKLEAGAHVQEMVAYGLFLNMDLFKKYGLEPPNTPEEFLECCQVFQQNGYQTPVGANRWWLEVFVLAIAYADLYNGGNTAQHSRPERSANSPSSPSIWMTSGFSR